jgi:Flagellar hook capping protein
MGVANVSGASGVAATADSAVPAAALSDSAQMENHFISLLVAQIKYQDPTRPVDSSEFLNQFSAMSQVKSMENMAQLTRNNLVLLDNLQHLTAAGLVGQEVAVVVDSVRVGTEPLRLQATLQHPSGSTVLRLTDASGASTVIELGPQRAGTLEYELDPGKLGLAPGSYTVTLESDNGELPTVALVGEVRNVSVSANGPVLELDGATQVPFYNILRFGRSSAGA